MLPVHPKIFVLPFLMFLFVQSEFLLGDCKTLHKESAPARLLATNQQRRLDNFVEFTDEGDQLAVESGANEKSETKREVLGKKTATDGNGRECANVQQAIYPIIPVIIASVIGLVGSIIIAGIVKIIFKFLTQSQDSDYGYGSESTSQYGAPGYSRRTGYGFLGLENVDYYKLMKNVLKAIEKVY